MFQLHVQFKHNLRNWTVNKSDYQTPSSMNQLTFTSFSTRPSSPSLMTRVIISARSPALWHTHTDAHVFNMCTHTAQRRIHSYTYSDVLHLWEQDPVGDFNHVVMQELPAFTQRPEEDRKPADTWKSTFSLRSALKVCKLLALPGIQTPLARVKSSAASPPPHFCSL